MTPATYTIPAHVSGDTWKGIDLISISINSSPPPESLVSAKIQFRKSAASSVVLELSTQNNTIVIVDAVNWQLNIPKLNVTLCPGTYVYDLQTVDADGNVATYLNGSWNILEDITR